MRHALLAAAALAVGVAVAPGEPARAQTIQVPADQVIANRKAGQDLLLAVAAELKRAVDGKVTDVKPYKNAGAGISAWMKVFPTQFPPGTDTGNTKALPAIWSDRAGFNQIAARLVAAGDDIAKAADANDPAAFAAAFQAAGQACADCHRTFRAK